MSIDKSLLEDCIAFMACRDAKRIADSVDRRLVPYNITRVQWNALYYIDLKKGESITQRELADLMGLREPTMVRLIDRMEKNGFLKREPSSHDRRRNNLVLTKKGAEINDKICAIVKKFKEDCVRGIPEADLLAFQRVLNQVVNNCVDEQFF
ncbi:MAG TPA: MarR family transcriptional regulator [Clostridiaceae bacterium]|jgi:MarR family transcriptional regulator for hemolysin|nr:MarR family transcriptional regulator [Clostridiaceae bacterium]